MHHSESRDRRRSGPAVPLAAALAAVPLVAALFAATAAAQTLAPQPDVVRQTARANRANWQLAERFNPAKLRPILYTTAVQPHWLGKSDSLWYNWRDGNGTRFYLVLPDSRTKRDLFDREKLAAQLAELSRKPVDANNLPFQTVTFTKDHKAFRFTNDSVRYEWSLGAGTLKSLGKPSKTPATDEERDTRGGGQGGGQFGAQGAEFRAYSPDSTAFAFARAHNLFVVEVNKADTLKSDTTQVTTDGVMDYSFGFRDTSENRRQLDALNQGQGGQGGDDNTDDVNSKDPRVRPRVVWSPDSKSFAVVRQDQRKVKELYLVNVLAEPRPVLVHYRYAMPGEENVPQNELWVFRRGDKAAKQLKVARWRDQRLMDLHFPLSGDKLRLVRQDRPQRAVELVEVDVASGAVKTLLTESVENASIDPQPVRYLKKGGDLVWWSERSGWGQLYAYDFNGGAKPKYALTSGAWHVDGVAGLDSTRGVLWFTGNGRESGENPYYQHMYRVASTAAGTSGVELLDGGNANHGETLSPTRRYFVDSYSRVEAPTKNVLRDATTGRVVMELGDADVSKLKEMGWRAPEQFVVKAADGVTDIYGNMWKPFDFDSTKKYPVVANVYPGPQTESVTVPFSPSNVPQYMAQLGMVVIQIGNRGGSPKRSAAYHRFGYGNAREYALADEKAGIEQLAAMHGYIDLDRVGIYGHSGGGFLTASAMLTPPYNEFYKAGWSESGNHDNNIYNQNWSEWNYGLKPVRPDSGARARGNLRAGGGRGVRAGASPDLLPNDATADDSLVGSAIASGALALADTGTVSDTSVSQYDSTRYEIHVPTTEELAANLRGNLALMTGDMDNNVHPGNTIRLANALMKANKRFDFYVVPGQPHGYRTSVNYTNHMMLEFFAEHLLGDYYRSDASMR